MLQARHARGICLQKAQRRGDIERAPATTAFARVITPAPPPADTAPIPLPPARPDRHDHLSLAARNYVLNHRPLQPKQPRPYPDTAHAVSAPFDSSLPTTGT